MGMIYFCGYIQYVVDFDVWFFRYIKQKFDMIVDKELIRCY